MRYQNLVQGIPLLAVTAAAARFGRRAADSPEIKILEANATTRWFEDSPQTQIFDIVVQNTGDSVWLTKDDELVVTVESESLKTTRPAQIKRIRPGDSAIVQVGVENADGVDPGSSGPAAAIAKYGDGSSVSLNVTATYGIGSYEASASSINSHESPDWWRNAKYGIFIHWGIYSVPAWGNKGDLESYAEWYWFWSMNPDEKSQTYQHHKEVYGTDKVYDDFIADFSASNFDAKEWVDFFVDSGARYFVPTTKHHDGFSLFDMPSEVSNRNSMFQNPHRNFIRELFDAATEHQPDLHKGAYFSLNEWYNPSYTESFYNDQFGIGPPINAYTGETVPYVGYTDVDNYTSGILIPQMNLIFNEYQPELLWCDVGDVGGPSFPPQMAADWLNTAHKNNTPVGFNNRCSTTIKGDFLTPEYADESTLSPRYWEATRGLDAYSYSYNAATPDWDYMNTSTIITTLVDTVSKNGNFLLGIGPKEDGTFPDVAVERLLEAGTWIHSHAESIFDTKYWPSGPGSGDMRYTTTDDTFYIHMLSKPNSTTTITDNIPYMDRDTVSVVGGSKNGTQIDAQLDNGQLVLSIPNEVVEADKYVWTFKFEY